MNLGQINGDKVVRHVITLMFGATICWGFVVRIIGVSEFLGLGGMVLAFWFQRSSTESSKPTNGGNDATSANSTVK